MKFFPLFRPKKAMAKSAGPIDSDDPKMSTKIEDIKEHQIIIETDKTGYELYHITMESIDDSIKLLDKLANQVRTLNSIKAHLKATDKSEIDILSCKSD